MSRITIVDLARILKVSKSTVARAFEIGSEINSETRERVITLANQLNFRPDHYASSLRRTSSRSIAIVVPEIANNFFSQVIHGIENVAQREKYSVLIYVTDGLVSKEKESIYNLSNRRVDGIVMSVAGEGSSHEHMNVLLEKKVPVVFFDRVYQDFRAPKVLTDDYESSFNATMHLLSCGCRVPICAVIDKDVSIGKERVSGFRDALLKNGFSYSKDLVVDCTNDLPINIKRIRQAFKLLKPDGLMATVERLAFAAYHASREIGLHIPNDIKIISFSSLEIAGLLNPSLSTITQPAFEMGFKSAELLFELISGETPSLETVILPSTLLKRSSTVSA